MTRLTLRRKLVPFAPPRPFVYKLGWTREQYVYFAYRMEFALWNMSMDRRYKFGYLDAGYCLDSPVDAIHRSYMRIDVYSEDMAHSQYTHGGQSQSSYMPTYDGSTIPSINLTADWSLDPYFTRRARR